MDFLIMSSWEGLNPSTFFFILGCQLSNSRESFKKKRGKNKRLISICLKVTLKLIQVAAYSNRKPHLNFKKTKTS